MKSFFFILKQFVWECVPMTAAHGNRNRENDEKPLVAWNNFRLFFFHSFSLLSAITTSQLVCCFFYQQFSIIFNCILSICDCVTMVLLWEHSILMQFSIFFFFFHFIFLSLEQFQVNIIIIFIFRYCCHPFYRIVCSLQNIH